MIKIKQIPAVKRVLFVLTGLFLLTLIILGANMMNSENNMNTHSAELFTWETGEIDRVMISLAHKD